MAGKSRRPVSDAQIIDEYQRLRSAKAVAALHSISDQTVYFVLAQHKIPTLSQAERRELSAPDKLILDRYAETHDGNKVAQELGVSSRTVYRVLQENGVISGKKGPRARVFASDVEINRLVESYEAGRSATQLAADYDCSVWTVTSTLIKAGVKIRSLRRIGAQEAAKAKKLYESGLTLKQTAERLGRSDQGIIRALNKHHPGVIRTADRLGPGGPHWMGGVTKSHGYLYEWVADDDPMVSMRGKNKYVFQHRLVMARKLNRPLRDNETVHHIDGNPLNNDPANLEVRQGRHGKHVVLCCLNCGSRNIGHVKLSED